MVSTLNNDTESSPKSCKSYDIFIEIADQEIAYGKKGGKRHSTNSFA
jgi:hypothetical protein